MSGNWRDVRTRQYCMRIHICRSVFPAPIILNLVPSRFRYCDYRLIPTSTRENIPRRWNQGIESDFFAKTDLRAGELSWHISDRPGFTPASKGLRGPFITSHNIYYVKPNMLVWGCLYVCILLIWWLIQQVNMPDVNNSSTKMGSCRSFGSKTVKTACRDKYLLKGRHDKAINLWRQSCRWKGRLDTAINLSACFVDEGASWDSHWFVRHETRR